jgi:hypothetical protein
MAAADLLQHQQPLTTAQAIDPSFVQFRAPPEQFLGGPVEMNIEEHQVNLSFAPGKLVLSLRPGSRGTPVPVF